LTNDAWTVIVNMDFNTYKQTIVKLREDIMLDLNKRKDETGIAIRWLHYTLYN